MEHSAFEERGWEEEEEARPRPLPSDLPKSLDDRQPVRHYGAETEIYDAWQGQSQVLSSPINSQPLAFNLNLNDEGMDATSQSLQDNDTRLMEMLAAQDAHREKGSGGEDEEDIVNDTNISQTQKKALLHKSLHNAASNGDLEQIGRLLDGAASKFIDINGPDEEGTAPIIYASCFVCAKATSLCRLELKLIVFRLRVTRILSLLFWKLVPKSIGKTRISGPR